MQFLLTSPGALTGRLANGGVVTAIIVIGVLQVVLLARLLLPATASGGLALESAG